MKMASGLLTAVTLTTGLWCAGGAFVEGQGCGRGSAVGNPHCTNRQCQLSATPINFGVYNVFDTQAVDSAGEITVTCSIAGSIRVSLGAGSFGTFQSRVMRAGGGGTDSLRYQVFVDQARQFVFGDGSSGTVVATQSTAQTATIRMYARLAPLQMVRAGDYSDQLQATFTF